MKLHATNRLHYNKYLTKIHQVKICSLRVLNWIDNSPGRRVYTCVLLVTTGTDPQGLTCWAL